MQYFAKYYDSFMKFMNRKMVILKERDSIIQIHANVEKF